jgi:hypothetical protein
MQLQSLAMPIVQADLALLRPGRGFRMIRPETDDEISKTLDKGCFNLHYPIVFDDGVQWLLRVRRDYHRPGHPISPPEFYWPSIEREATTLQVLYQKGIRTVSNAYLPPSRISVTPGLSLSPRSHSWWPSIPLTFRL